MKRYEGWHGGRSRDLAWRGLWPFGLLLSAWPVIVIPGMKGLVVLGGWLVLLLAAWQASRLLRHWSRHHHRAGARHG